MTTSRFARLVALVALLVAVPVVNQRHAIGQRREGRAGASPTEASKTAKEGAALATDESGPHEEAVPPRAAKPKPLGATAQRGLQYLVNQQHTDGGWGQGGGWRQNLQNGGRIEDANVEDPSDVGNTCIAVLALVRAGNTPNAGPWAKNVRRGLEFICQHVEKADKDSIYVTDVRDTQLQIKIGRYVDTFLAALVLSELKADGALLVNSAPLAALDKTIAKIERNQTKEGTFEGNAGWASVLSVGIASKALNRAKQAGANVKDETLDRDFRQAALALEERKPTALSSTALGGKFMPSLAASSPADAAGPSDAGVALYFQAANTTRLQDRVNTQQADKKQAESIVASQSAKSEEKAAAQRQLDQINKTEETQRKAVSDIVGRLDDKTFMAGIGNNGGEEFLSYMNIGETLVVQGGSQWDKWVKSMDESLSRVQNEDGSWSGQHCITGRTFCTAAALLTLTADRAPLPTVNGQFQQARR